MGEREERRESYKRNRGMMKTDFASFIILPKSQFCFLLLYFQLSSTWNNADPSEFYYKVENGNTADR